jgi:hypothetical protein
MIMKNFINILSTAIFTILILQACKKSSGSNGNNLPDPVNAIISQDIIDSLQKWGMKINPGKTPPSLNGVYLAHPYVCSFDNSRFQAAGLTFSDYKYKFFNQDNSSFTIRVDYKNAEASTDSGSDVTATYIAGNGTAFTIFAQVTGIETGINYTALALYSGEIQNGSLNNFQTAYYLKSKDADPLGELINPGDCRILYDSDNVSESVATYSFLPVLKSGANDNGITRSLMSSNRKSGEKNN